MFSLYLSNFSLRFQKRIKAVFHKHCILIRPPYSRKIIYLSSYKYKSVLKYLMQVSSINTVDCHLLHMGTARQIFGKVADHKGKDKRSAIFNHLFNGKGC